jgi:hypothetical protein
MCGHKESALSAVASYESGTQCQNLAGVTVVLKQHFIRRQIAVSLTGSAQLFPIGEGGKTYVMAGG